MNAEQYAPLAIRTAGTVNFEPSLLNAALGIAGEAAEVLAVTIESNVFAEQGREIACKLLKELGDWIWYANLACHILEHPLHRLVPEVSADEDADLLLSSCDLVIASGHFADSVKKLVFHQKAADIPALLCNIRGGVLMIDNILSRIGYTWSDLFEANIAKLAARYPAGTFDPIRANNRDEEAEQAAVAKVL